MTIQNFASFEADTTRTSATSKLVKAWEAKNAKRAVKASGATLMALSLSACGGSDDVAAPTTPATPETPVVTPVSLTLTSAQNIITSAELTTGADSIAATQATIGSTDVIVDGTAGDGDTLTVASNGAAINLGTVAGIENIVVNVTDFGAAGVITATNVADGTLTVNNLQAAGSTDAAIDAAGSITIVAGSGVTGDLDVNMAADAATIVNTGGAATVDIDADNTDGEQTASVVVVDDVDLQVVDATTLNISAADGATVTLNASSEDLAGEDSTIAVTGTGVTLVAADADDIDGTVVTGATVETDMTTVTGNAFDMTGITGTLVINAAAAAAADTVTVADGATVELEADVTVELAFNDGATGDTTATATVILSEASTAGNGSEIQVEETGDTVGTLNIVADANQTAGDLVLDIETDVVINLSGAGNVDISMAQVSAGESTLNAAALTGVLTATADAELLTITGGSGNDVITALTAAEFVLDGGAGVDTLTTAADMTSGTFTGFEVMALGQATNDFLASQLSGQTMAITGGTDIEINAASSVDIASIDLSGLSFATATVDVVVDLTARDANALLANQGFTYIGSGAVDTVIGSANVDTISLGEGADTVTAGLGADIIDLTENTAAIDTVVMTTGGAIAADTIIGFTAGAGGDNVDIDLSDINAIVTDLNTADAAVAATAAASQIGQVAVGAFDMGSAAAGDNILNIVGDYASATALETALEVGGTSALTADGAVTAGDAFLVLYDNGSDSFLATVTSAAGAADDATFAAGDLTVTSIMEFTGVADSASFVAANFDIIA
ncbi:hypothetical protein SAMN05444486_104132 [Lentibacter algarum]|uniref:Uncharacterized protein n=1 Tax=Lentibacter algarum TaxID=576131 RepID=A0A1H3N2G3_9RHOB|nr:hypothetical protein [Lentibacter algarum]SDY82954.1 hypothetical protein SAMN05444486_104132 [Lentibacter algarum]